MSITTTAHLNFRGNAREALEFYHSVFGGDIMIVTYGDFGMPKELPDAGKVVWGQVTAADGFRVMAYDVPGHAVADGAPQPSTRRENGMTLTGEPFFLSVRGETVEEVGALWEKLADGATVIEAYGPAQWAPAFGMLTDRFGITWILDVAAPYAHA
ncbi:VOC family protein [Micromonospora fiedleri]|uniref:VOC family protein n=1 Tax=Micromonospora fiedleri TaxID=1157498 RepID=A0ABS1USK4_9ACTN|nr:MULTISPECIES: VOC family protein [Micromonospora]MBL6279345.1 VOC family protein [Micromonospora fiedleri]WSK40894.1 VOC family protein [Micromonospora maris]